MVAEEGFVIGDRTYPFPTAFRLCDPVLVTQLTGMSWMEFVELLEDSDRQDPASMAGMIGVAVWQGHPKWSRDRVVRFVEQLDMEAVTVQGGETEAAEVVPPSEAVEPSPSPLSPEGSSRAPVFPSEPTGTPASTGQPVSDISSLPSLQAV